MAIPLSHVIFLDGGIWWRRGTWRWNHVDVYLFHADFTIDRMAYHALGAFPRMENEIGMFVLAGW